MTKNFNELGLSEKTLAAIDRLGYDMPTPVQEQAIPIALSGKDIIAAAKTGTGKTAAFSLPSLDRLGHAKKGQEPLMLVVTPTRELATQIGEVCEIIAKTTNHRIATVVGGVSYMPQINRLKKGVDVLIATPGRLIDLMEQEAVKLSKVNILVLDEADRMLDMGFWPSIKKIVAQIPSKRQTMLFSATIDRSIVENSGAMLTEPVYVEIAHRGETADTVDQYVIPVSPAAKSELLKAVLEDKGWEKVIVFARTRSRADSNARRLKKAGYTAEAIHSDRSQAQRKKALDNFVKGKTNILVATDVLARGIDINEVNYVVNFDLPNQPEDYIHRIGRTGRAGERGFSISFVSPEQKPWLKDIEKLIKKQIPVMEIEGFDPTSAEEKAAERATRYAAKKDPEIAAAAKEVSKRKKKLKQQPATHSYSPKSTKQGNRKSAPKSSDHKRKIKPSKPSKAAVKKADMRPGRAQRAAIAKKRNAS